MQTGQSLFIKLSASFGGIGINNNVLVVRLIGKWGWLGEKNEGD